jgi:hypothetical protein
MSPYLRLLLLCLCVSVSVSVRSLWYLGGASVVWCLCGVFVSLVLTVPLWLRALMSLFSWQVVGTDAAAKRALAEELFKLQDLAIQVYVPN